MKHVSWRWVAAVSAMAAAVGSVVAVRGCRDAGDGQSGAVVSFGGESVRMPYSGESPASSWWSVDGSGDGSVAARVALWNDGTVTAHVVRRGGWSVRVWPTEWVGPGEYKGVRVESGGGPESEVAVTIRVKR